MDVKESNHGEVVSFSKIEIERCIAEEKKKLDSMFPQNSVSHITLGEQNFWKQCGRIELLEEILSKFDI